MVVKILIADDEYYTTQMVNSQMDWKLLGIDRVLLAYNGLEAVEIFDAEKPDIVLCDIEMPGMNGLDVLNHVMHVAPKTKFIFLTCFERFDYAKQAIHLGAFDYLTKPFSEPEACAAIMKASAGIRDGQTEQAGIGQEDFFFLGKLVSQAISPDKAAVEYALSRSHTSFDAGRQYRIVLSCISEHNNAGTKEAGICHFVFRNMLAEMFKGNAESMDAVELAWDGIYGLLQAFPEEVPLTKLMEAAERLSCSTENHLHTAYTCVIGNPVNLWEFPDLLIKLRKMVSRQFLNSVKIGIAHPEQENDGQNACGIDEKLIRQALDEQNAEKISDYLRSMLDELQQKVLLSPEVIHQINMDLMQTCLSFCSERDITAHELFQDPEIVELQKRAEQMPFYLIRCIELVCARICALLHDQSDETIIVKKIERYVREHYREPIGRDEIAAYLHYSNNYLSKLFSRHIGIAVRDYINAFRVDAAKKMLRETTCPIGDIALDVGFDSMAYFSTVFRKSTGITPAQYRSRTRA